MITDPEEFFQKGCGRCARFDTPDCSTRFWLAGLEALRRICLSEGLQETAKWGHPCYMHAGRNIAIIGAFRGDFRLTFFNAALLDDRNDVLTRQGENTQTPDAVHFTETAAVAGAESAIRDLIRQAKAHAEAGTKPAKAPAALDMPEELAEALDGDPRLAEAFHALTPGRQRSHALAVGSAKTSATRAARVVKLTPLILSGKGAQER